VLGFQAADCGVGRGTDLRPCPLPQLERGVGVEQLADRDARRFRSVGRDQHAASVELSAAHALQQLL
jgi:hypothetical protein